jgi:hypothetical protein
MNDLRAASFGEFSELSRAGKPLACRGRGQHRPSIGLLLGTETKTERFHSIGLAALSSENFGSAMDQMARYKQLTCPEEILQEVNGGEWSIQLGWLLAHEVDPQVLIECCFAWVLSTARLGTGTRISPLRMEFVQPPAHVKTIERHFGCPVVYGAPRNAIIFRVTDGNHSFVTRNAELLGPHQTFVEAVPGPVCLPDGDHRPPRDGLARFGPVVTIHVEARSPDVRTRQMPRAAIATSASWPTSSKGFLPDSYQLTLYRPSGWCFSLPSAST